MTEKRMAAAALLISVFMAGGLAGVAVWQVVDRAAAPNRAERFDRRGFERRGPPRGGRSPGGPGGARSPGMASFAPMWLAGRLADELDLTEDQQALIEGIITDREAESAELLRELRPRLEAQLDSTNSAIRALLTADQQDLFDEFMESGRARFPGRDGRFGPGGDERFGPGSRGRPPPRN